MKAFLLLAFVMLFSVPALAQNRVLSTNGEANVELWLPQDFQSGKGPWPLIIFSHAFGGCAKQSTFLTQYLADNGYIVAAPDHADGRPCKSSRAYEMQQDMLERIPEEPFRQPALWSDKTYTARRDDVLFTLSSILEDPLFKGFVDEDKIALIGHSLGGYTALGLAGGWASWKDKRFKAVLALSPYAAPYFTKKTLGGVDVPVLYIGGTRDNPFTPKIKQTNGAYSQTKPPKYFIELEGAGHSSFTEQDKRFEPQINAAALAFFDKYLKGTEAVINPGKKAKGVKTYWEQEKPAADQPKP